MSDHEDWDSDSAVDVESIGSSTQSLTSSILNYEYENGRRYHGFRAGQYFMPNDNQEQEVSLQSTVNQAGLVSEYLRNRDGGIQLTWGRPRRCIRARCCVRRASSTSPLPSKGPSVCSRALDTKERRTGCSRTASWGTQLATCAPENAFTVFRNSSGIWANGLGRVMSYTMRTSEPLT